MINRGLPRRSLYLEIIDLILDGIKRGKYRKNARLPSEDKLAAEFSVSRATLREALRVLEEDGILIRQHGKGTFIRDRKVLPVQNLSSILSLSNAVKNVGLEDQITSNRYQKIRANRRIAEKLQIQPGDEVLEIERVRTIDKQPALYSIDILPIMFLPEGAEERFPKYLNSIYKFLIEVCQQEIREGLCTIKPILCDESFARIFHVTQSTPLMYIEMIDFNSDKKPLLYAREYYLADLFEFRVTRRKEGEEQEVPRR